MRPSRKAVRLPEVSAIKQCFRLRGRPGHGLVGGLSLGYNQDLLSRDRAVVFTREELELHKIVVSRAYAPGALDFLGAEFRQISPLQVDVVAELIGGEIRIRGHLSVRVEEGCDRCLGPVEIEVKPDFDLIYRPVGEIAREEQVEVPPDELDIGFYSGEGVALTEVVTEQVILAMPMKTICRPDCQGLCPVCGANRNLVQCHCPGQQTDSPFASLKNE
jgi:uncharacterized protein